MKPVRYFLMGLLILAGGAAAETVAPDMAATAPPEAAAVPAPIGPWAASDIALEAQLYQSRPVVVFADNPANPQFIRQMQLLERDLAELAGRDVVVVIDSDPDSASEWRKRLRPRGFSLVILDKDLRPVARIPSPSTVREINRTIDALPSRRQEVLERFGAGR